MLLTNKILVGRFTNGKDQGYIYKIQCNDWNVDMQCLLFEVKNKQIGNLLEYTKNNDIIEYHIKKQLNYLYCNNDTIINSINVALILQ